MNLFRTILTAAAALAFAAPAFPQSCSPYVPVCQSPLDQFLDALKEAGTEYGRELGREGSAIDAQIKASRAKLLQTSPSSPAFSQVVAGFSTALRRKDVYCLKIELLPDAVMEPLKLLGLKDPVDMRSKAEEAVDGGVRVFAAPLFRAWVGYVKARTGPQMVGFLLDWSRQPNTGSFEQALKESIPAYDRYRLARDWAEFASASRPLASDPEAFATRLLAIDQPWSNDFTVTAPDFMDKAGEYYRTMTSVLGRETVTAAAQKLAAARVGKEGLLEPPLVLNGWELSNPVNAMFTLAAEATPRNHIIVALSKTDTGTRNLPAGEKVYQSMVDIFGESVVQQAARRVMAAPKNKDGFLRAGFRVNGQEFSEPEPALIDLLGEGNSRNYGIVIAAKGTLNTLQLQGGRISAQLQRGELAYRHWVAAYGEGAIAAAAERVREAPKKVKTNGALEDPVRLGGIPGRPTAYGVFRDLLEQAASPRDRLRAMLAFHDGLDSAAAVDAAYADFISRYPEQPVFKAVADVDKAVMPGSLVAPEYRNLQSRRFAGADPGDYYSVVTGILNGSRKVPTSSDANIVEHPVYTAWKNFAPGTAVTYAKRIQGDPNTTVNPTLITRKLVSKDVNGVKVEETSRYFAKQGPVDRDNGAAPYPSRVYRDAIRDVSVPANFVNEETGVETLDIGGKPYSCRWRKLSYRISVIITIWSNDDVPGGLVRRTDQQATVGKPLITEILLQPFQIENLKTLTKLPNVVFGPTASAAVGAPRKVTTVPDSPAPTPGSIPAGTRLIVRTMDLLTAASVKAGTPFHARLEQPVLSGGQVVLAQGTVIALKVQNVGSTSVATRLAISADYAVVDGKRITLTTTAYPRLMTAAGRMPAGTPITLTVTSDAK